jgi:hypothetical protein
MPQPFALYDTRHYPTLDVVWGFGKGSDSHVMLAHRFLWYC